MASGADVNLVYRSIAYFLKSEIELGKYSPEITESLEVAKQCIESAFNFTADGSEVAPDLLQLFGTSGQSSQQQQQQPQQPQKQNYQQKTPVRPEPSEEDKTTAETLKNQGNLCMKDNKFEEAVICYSKAIELWPCNAVYYSNRAAAYSRMDQQDKAIEDCRTALQIDPKYSKAYGRMGVAYSSLGDYAKAAEAYRKGLELDPTNENCQQNLAFAEERLNASGGVGGAAGGGGFPPTGLGGLDLGALLNNPMMQNMACQLMRDPNAQNIMTGLFQNAFGGTSAGADSTGTTDSTTNANRESGTTTNGPAASAADEPTGSVNMDNFLRLGQQLAQQLRSSNPQLVDQLRQSFLNNPPSSASNDSSGAGDTK